VRPLPFTVEPSSPFAGKGVWIWYLNQAEGGNLEAIAAKAKAHNIDWVAVKAGDGNVIWTQFRRAVALKEFGLKVFSWSYNYGAGNETVPILDAIRVGSDGHIFDIEAEFARQPNSTAAAVNILDKMPNGVPLAYAPLPVIDNFPNLPYLAFNSYGAAALPQFYTKELGTGSDYPLSRLMDIWERWQAGWSIQTPAILPVLQAYGDQTAENLLVEAQICKGAYGGFSAWRWDTLSDAMWEAIRDV